MNERVSGLSMPIVTNSHASAQRPHHLPIVFTGSGSEYFRIWIVNLLLMIVTLGLYYPWAKVRRLRYFHGNTLVGGEALDFHGDPKKMLKGFLLVGLLLVVYSAAGNFSPTAGFVAFLIVVAIWPALLKSSMQFRLANTSWRGLRFCFNGSLADVYRAVLPLFVPGAIILGALAGVADPDKPPAWYGYTTIAVMLLALLLAPWLLWNLKQYQHNHYGLASLQTSFRASLGSFYTLQLKISGVALLAILTTAALVGIGFFLLAGDVRYTLDSRSAPAAVLGAMLGGIAGLVAMLVVIKPYATSRLQNLLWSRTGNPSIRFLSHLKFRPLLWLTVKNWLLVILTLGLYWPFAAVALARMRLQAVTVKTRVDLDTLVGQMRQEHREAAGDAAGDLFGVDIGL
ncbi:YjgN family protein [Rhodoferax sp.]|uniref:YjgN family protein n=1 Tax=Rhodoferax sp. TaxID=50421 RepID=UPI00274D8751|nr:YjgN family protein [Rhodoferax sp.]